MSSTHTYRVLRSSWGVLITIVAESRPAEASPVDAVPLGSGVWVLDATPNRSLSGTAMRMLARGIEPLAAEISSAVGGANRIIAIQDVRYNESDFQIEGLAAAVHGWAIAEFGLDEREIPVSFDRDKNRYVFTLPDAGFL